jgi:hypothetical protein
LLLMMHAQCVSRVQLLYEAGTTLVHQLLEVEARLALAVLRALPEAQVPVPNSLPAAPEGDEAGPIARWTPRLQDSTAVLLQHLPRPQEEPVQVMQTTVLQKADGQPSWRSSGGDSQPMDDLLSWPVRVPIWHLILSFLPRVQWITHT